MSISRTVSVLWRISRRGGGVIFLPPGGARVNRSGPELPTDVIQAYVITPHEWIVLFYGAAGPILTCRLRGQIPPQTTELPPQSRIFASVKKNMEIVDYLTG